jgi:hypothetical protein
LGWPAPRISSKLGRMKFNTLTTRILGGLVLGLGLGAALAAANPGWRAQAVSLAEGLGNVWLDGLRMTIIPLVFSLLVIGVAQAAGTARAGGLAAKALLAFGVLLLVSATIGAIATPALLSFWPPPAAAVAALRASAHGAASVVPPSPPLTDWLRSFVPPNPIKAAAEGAMASVVFFALVFGLAAARQDEPRRAALFGFFDAVQAAMMTIVGWVLWAAPGGVFLLALSVGAKLGMSAVGLLGQYVVVVSICCLLAGGMGLVMALVGGRAAAADRADPGRGDGDLDPVVAGLAAGDAGGDREPGRAGASPRPGDAAGGGAVPHHQPGRQPRRRGLCRARLRRRGRPAAPRRRRCGGGAGQPGGRRRRQLGDLLHHPGADLHGHEPADGAAAHPAADGDPA